MDSAVRNILFFTVEFPPVRRGGLWIVSEGIPMALNRYAGKDVRVVVPYYARFDTQDGWQPTDVVLPVAVPWGEGLKTEFRVHERYDDGIENVVYGIENEYIRDVSDLYASYVSGGGMETGESPNGDPAPGFQNLMLFNHAALALAQRLDGARGGGANGLQSFDGAVDAWILNDWMTGPIGGLANGQPVGKLFILHNVYDSPQYDDVARAFGLPDDCNASPLNTLKHADVLVADRNFFRMLVSTPFLENQDMTHVKESLIGKRAVQHDVHHGIGDDLDPRRNRTLASTDGFRTLTVAEGQPAWESVRRYKDANRRGLQRFLGLEENDDAVLYCWTSRLDRLQKGFDLVIDEFETFMAGHADVQLVILGAPHSDDPRIQAFLDTMAARFAGRFLLTRTPYEHQALVNAGTHYSLMPSTYEPFGLAQLQAMKLGCVPLAHPVDGLRTTLSDPGRNAANADAPESAWDYGQTAVLMDAVPVVEYMAAVRRLIVMERYFDHALDFAEASGLLRRKPRELAAWTAAHDSFRAALDRSFALAKDVRAFADVASNGIRYVDERHSWRTIATLYEDPLLRAARAAASRRG